MSFDVGRFSLILIPHGLLSRFDTCHVIHQHHMNDGDEDIVQLGAGFCAKSPILVFTSTFCVVLGYFRVQKAFRGSGMTYQKEIDNMVASWCQR